MARLISPLLALLLCCAGCWSSDVLLFEVDLGGTVDETAPETSVWVEAYYQSIGSGELETDIFLIDAFEVVGGGDFSHQLTYPVDGGRGLFVFAWADLDGDGALCAPGVTDEPVGGLRLDRPTEEPADELQLVLDGLCTSPERLAATLQP